MISGTNFIGAIEVQFGGVEATSFTVHLSTSITALLPAGNGTVDVQVFGPGGGSLACPRAAISIPTQNSQRPHTLRVHLQNLDKRTPALQPKPNPSNFGAKQLKDADNARRRFIEKAL
jgi:hypothetical protein